MDLGSVVARLYRAVDSASYLSTAEFFRTNDDSSATSLGIVTHTGTGFATFESGALTELVGENAYVVRAALLTAVIDNARFLWFEIDYDMKDFRDAY